MRKENLLISPIVLLSILILITIFSRVCFFEDYFYGYDSVNYALGVIDYSLENTRPHLPGSILFVNSLKGINYFTNNIHLSFLILVNIFSVLATLFSFLSFNRFIYDMKISTLLTLLLIFNPMVWFYSSVTEIYVFDWFFSALILYLSRNKNSIYWLPFVFAIGAGFRPSSGVFLLPFYFYLVFKCEDVDWKKLLNYWSVSIIIFLGWLIPLISTVGGIKEYFFLFNLNNPMEQISFLQNIFRLSSYSIYILLPFIILYIFGSKSKTNKEMKLLVIKILIFILPALFYFIFFHYSKGYALLIVTPVVLLVGIQLGNRNNVKIIKMVIILEVLIFILLPAKHVSIESKLKPSVRESAIWEIGLDRTFSDYSLTMNGINARDSQIYNIKRIFESCNDSIINLGPLLSNLGRPLQFEFPNKIFFSISFKDINEYILFNKLGVKTVLLDKANKNSLLLLRYDLYEKYFFQYKIHIKFENLVSLKLNDNLFNNFQNISNSLFVR